MPPSDSGKTTDLGLQTPKNRIWWLMKFFIVGFLDLDNLIIFRSVKNGIT